MLKSLEMHGFKSFADRTVFEFSAGVTCVVGPNGSGKSNVVDAIKWLLGDQSPKSLRGQEMSDVIFNGSAGRKPGPFAEASLTFDNSQQLFAIDTSDVKIGRRLYRSGDSEYLLNGNVVRLKDVKDLFMGTGAGTAAYSIIEQGRVDQILQANPTTRRVVFEEAAGISRFKSRRIDAERKLERVAQNLLRLTDIVDEAEAQLNSTRSQATKAARYRELSQELRTLWTGLAADDCRHLTAELAAVEQRAQDRRRQIDELNSRVSEIEAGKLAIDSSLSSREEGLRQVERRASANREAIAAHESTIRHQTLRWQELDADIERLRKQRNLLCNRSAAVVGELAATAQRLTDFENSFQQHAEALRVREQHIAALQEKLDEQRSGASAQRTLREQRRQRRAENSQRVSVLASQCESAAAELDAVHGRLAAQDALLDQAIIEAERRQGLLDEAEQRRAAAADALGGVQSQQSELAGRQMAAERKLAEQREQRSAWQARMHVLEDLDRRQEGVGVGVREILRRARATNYTPWNRILGSVGELIDVSLDDAPLVEVALGSRAELIVVDDLRPLIEYLNVAETPILGRVGFVDLRRKEAAGEGPPLDLTGQPGVVTRADRLVQAGERVRPLIARLLGSTWIVETLDDALRLASPPATAAVDAPAAAAIGNVPRPRFVTLQGELLDADGTLFAGTVPSDSAVVSRRSELRQLQLDLQRLDRDIESDTLGLHSLGRSLSTVGGSLSEAEESLRLASEAFLERRSHAAAQLDEVERLRTQRAGIERELDDKSGHRVRLEQELEESRRALDADEDELHNLQETVGRTEQETARIDQQLQTLRDQTKSEQVELAKHEERLISLRDVHVRLESDQVQRVQQRDEAEQRLGTALETRRKIVLEILRTESEVARCFLVAESLDREIRKQAAERSELRSRRSMLARQEDQWHVLRRRLTDELHEAELRQREMARQIAGLEERLEEEYQLKLTDVTASGVSAFQDYLAARMRGKGHALADADDEQEDGPPLPVEGMEDNGGAAGAPVDTRAADGASAVAHLRFEDVRDEIEARVNRLRRKIKLMGHVNTEALRDLDELEYRFGHLSAQLHDLQEAKATLEEIIRRINLESRRLFLETFEAIRTHFRELFRKLFGGGEGDIILEDPENVLDCGIDIVARPPGKELRSITLLSGGEKTMTAVALLFAMFKSKPSPYCILDEVDAALDDANVERYAAVVKDFREMTQFVIITHRKRTMTAADVLYGVTMEQAGVSKRMSVRFEDVSENGEFRSRGAA